MTEALTREIFLSGVYFGSASAIRYGSTLKSTGIQPKLLAAATAAKPYNISVFSFRCFLNHGQMTDPDTFFYFRIPWFIIFQSVLLCIVPSFILG